MLWISQVAKCCGSLYFVVLSQACMREPNLLTQKALAAFLSVDRITIWSWHLRDAGPPRILIGKRYYYSMVAIREWLRTNDAHSSSASSASSQAPAELQTTS